MNKAERTASGVLMIDGCPVKLPLRIELGMYGCDSGCEYLWLMDADGDEVAGLEFSCEVPETLVERFALVERKLRLELKKGELA